MGNKETEWLGKLKEKYEQTGQEINTYLEGLYHARPKTYWDYIETETLLSLQKPRTYFPDELVFIIYHQITELFLKLIEHEIDQLTGDALPGIDQFKEKLPRIKRYAELLVDSFDVMRVGMSFEQYNQFRTTLTPASGFQSVAFRRIELKCTRIINLINDDGKKNLSTNPDINELFDNLYWWDAGRDKKTGKKTLTLQLFEKKYITGLKQLAQEIKGKTLEEKILNLKGPEDDLKQIYEMARVFDLKYNVEWPKAHLKTAEYFLEGPQGTKAATGGSDWKRYLHPKYQKRKFFPSLWSKEELDNWGE